MRKRLYISGPISNGGKAGPEERLVNVQSAAHDAMELMRIGFSVQCPQLTEYLEILTGIRQPHEVWMENDKPWVLVSEIVYRRPGASTGSDMEVAWAYEHSIPVVYSIAEAAEWRRRELEPKEITA
jgi:hypothetical protein